MSREIVLFPSDETIQKVRESLGLDERSAKEAVEGLKKWLELQPHLPDEDDGRLERFLIRCKNNMEKTKRTIDMYFTLRTQIPELMTGWDVNDPWFVEAKQAGFLNVETKLTEELNRISIFGLRTDIEKFNIYDNFKVLLMSLDIRMCEDYHIKDIYIIDLKNITATFVKYITLPAVKKLADCALKGYNCRVKSVHLVNTSPVTEILITFAKSVLRNKLADRLYVYGSDLTDLYNHVPKTLLPKEYGGENGTVEEHNEAWTQKLISYRDWFVEQEKKKSDESKRPGGRLENNDMFGIDGSFRQMTLD